MKIIPVLPLFLLFACSNEMQVQVDSDRDVPVQLLTDYNWLPVGQIESRNNPLFYNELTDKRIKAAVDAQLAEKGYVKSDTTALMIVHYHLVIENKASVRPEPFGYNYGQYWLKNELDTYRYNEGTLIIDFMDVRNCDLIWRGSAVSIFEEDTVTEELINKAVHKIFRNFPVSIAKDVDLQ